VLSRACSSRTFTRTLSPAFRIDPFTTASTPRSFAVWASDRVAPIACAAPPDELEITFNEPISARSAMSPSVIPSPR
jgi:hypothetical protein